MDEEWAKAQVLSPESDEIMAMLKKDRCLVTGAQVDKPEVVTCRCENCCAYMNQLEDDATCEHGFLVGCPTC